MPNHGIKISKEGIDVKTASNLEIILSSQFNQYKIFAQGSFAVTVEAGQSGGYTVISHNLGYIPSCNVYMEATAGDGRRFMTDYFNGSVKIEHSINENDLTVSAFYPIFSPPGSTQIHSGYYFIYKDNLV